jgi:arylsulfatase A-like enzyme
MVDGNAKPWLVALIVTIAAFPAIVATKWMMRPAGDEFPKVPARVSMSVALITVGSLPAETLRIHDPKQPPQAGSDELARVGISCHFAIAAADTEPAATVSILTGQLPSTHGVIGFDDRLATGRPTLPRQFSSIGLATGAFVNQPFCSLTGFDTEFDHAHEDLRSNTQQLADAAERWIETLGRRNFFLWVHCEPDPALGDAATTYSALVDAVSNALKRTRWYEGTVIAAAGTRDERGGDLVVPLVFKIPMRQPMSAKRTGPCSTLDIYPTVLDLISVDPTPRQPGRSLVTVKGGASPLFSGHHFIDRGLSERFEPGSKDPVQSLRGPQYEILFGPQPGALKLLDRSKAPAAQRDLAADKSDATKRILDAMLKELFDRRKRMADPWPRAKAPAMPDATRAVLAARAP